MNKFTRIMTLVTLAGTAGCTGTTPVSSTAKTAITNYVTALQGDALKLAAMEEAIGGLDTILANPTTAFGNRANLSLIWQADLKERGFDDVAGADLWDRVIAYKDSPIEGNRDALSKAYANTVKHFADLVVAETTPTGATAADLADIAVYDKLIVAATALTASALEGAYDTAVGSL